MSRLWEVADPATWGLLSVASICLLAGFILLSHSLVRGKAHGDQWRGWTAGGRLEWTIRGGLALLLAGGFFWALTLDAPGWSLAILGVGTLVPAGLQAAAMARGES